VLESFASERHVGPLNHGAGDNAAPSEAKRLSRFVHRQWIVAGIVEQGTPADKPDPWWNVPEKERKRRIKLTSDTCIIDDNAHYVRAVLEIPIIGQTSVTGR
jgi:hypothetical protein